MKYFMKPILWIYCVYILSLTAFFVFVVPPYEKPDEIAHFNRAFALSKGQLFCQRKPEGYGFTLPESVIQFPQAMFTGAIIMQTDNKFPIQLLKKTYPIYPSNDVIFENYCSLPFISYIPSAVGMNIAAPFNNLLLSFYAARIGIAVFFIVLLAFSLFIIPPQLRLLLAAFSIIPMVIHQATAVSYDAPSIALSMVVFAFFAKYIESKPIRFLEYVLFTGILSIFLLVKPGYYLLFGLLIPIFLKVKGACMQKCIAGFLSLGFVYMIFQIAIHF